ncbi:CAP domain-containing protein [Metabacillus sp. 84]|uniref:CAP domain-containing protein n=1 Tax=unclassified Metabacillus TaxID=2675274 RepID=UPI003CE827F7
MRKTYRTLLAVPVIAAGILAGCTMNNDTAREHAAENSQQQKVKVSSGYLTAEKTAYHTDTPSTKTRNVDYSNVNQSQPNMEGQLPNGMIPGAPMPQQPDTGQTPQAPGYGQAPDQTPPPEQQPNQGQQPDQNQQPGKPEAEDMTSIENQVVQLTNKERQKNGLEPLKADNSLANVAQEKSDDMQENNYFSHTSPTYGSPFDMMKKFGQEYQTAGENIAQGQQSPEEVVNAWMNSQGHRENIMNSEFTNIGIGFNKEGNYWTQMFTGK